MTILSMSFKSSISSTSISKIPLFPSIPGLGYTNDESAIGLARDLLWPPFVFWDVLSDFYDLYPFCSLLTPTADATELVFSFFEFYKLFPYVSTILYAALYVANFWTFYWFNVKLPYKP
jgi:hypothetical protein